MPGAVIGERCSLGQNVVVMNGTRIGANCKIQNNVSIYEGVELEEDVFCGPSMVFTNVVNPRSHVSRKNEYKRTLVKRGASIGANATIVCGVTLGVPAKRIGWMCQCGERLPDSGVGTCKACGTTYERRGEGIAPIARS